MCTFAHGRAELRRAYDEDVPEHVKRIRARQDNKVCASEPRAKRARGSEEEDQVAGEEAHSDDCSEPPSPLGSLVIAAAEVLAAAAGAEVPLVDPAAMDDPVEPPPAAKSRPRLARIRAKAKPRRASELPAAAAEPEDDDDAAKPTRICIVGFAEPACIYLGTQENAFSTEWLESRAIRNLVQCMHGHTPRLSAGTKFNVFLVPGVGWNDLHDIEFHFHEITLSFDLLKNTRGNTFFFCTDGQHRSAVLLSMFLLYRFPAESPDEVMAKVKRVRPGVKFNDVPGRFPAAMLVRLWSDWLHHGCVPEEVKARLVNYGR